MAIIDLKSSKEDMGVSNPETQIKTFQGSILVDFFATWCGPCKIIAPIIESVKKRYEGKIKVLKVDIDENSGLAEQYEVMSVPTLLFFSYGKLIRREIGFISESKICEIIDSELL